MRVGVVVAGGDGGGGGGGGGRRRRGLVACCCLGDKSGGHARWGGGMRNEERGDGERESDSSLDRGSCVFQQNGSMSIDFRMCEKGTVVDHVLYKFLRFNDWCSCRTLARTFRHQFSRARNRTYV